MRKTDNDISNYLLHAREGEEHLIPKYAMSDLELKFWDLDSLIKIYGKAEVYRFLTGKEIRLGGKG